MHYASTVAERGSWQKNITIANKNAHDATRTLPQATTRVIASIKKKLQIAAQKKFPRRDSRRKLVTIPYRAVPCRRDCQMNPIFELGHRKKVSMKKLGRDGAGAV